jgi:AcrR family transcriptional regulator
VPHSREATHLRILEAAYALFFEHGFRRVNVDEVAAAAGVTKRTLYDHIRSKDDLLAEVLERQSSVALQHTARWSARSKPDPSEFVIALFDDLTRWMMKPGSAGSGFSRVVMELADLPGHPARTVAKAHKAAIERWFADELASRQIADAPLVARSIWVLVEGAMLLTLIHNDAAYIRVARDIAVTLLRPAL